MTATTAVDTARATDDADDDVSNDARTRARDRAMDETRAVRVVVVDARAVGVARMRTARDAFESDVSERSGRLRVRRVTRARARVSRVSRRTGWTWPS
mgnify:FL=1